MLGVCSSACLPVDGEAFVMHDNGVSVSIMGDSGGVRIENRVFTGGGVATGAATQVKGANIAGSTGVGTPSSGTLESSVRIGVRRIGVWSGNDGDLGFDIEGVGLNGKLNLVCSGLHAEAG